MLKVVGRWIRRLNARLRDRMHSPHPADFEQQGDCVNDSRYSCATAMFQRAAQPLDGVHPALAALLAHNRDRDILLNETLTRLFNQADTWRVKAETATRTIGRLQSECDAIRARTALFDEESKACRAALAQLQTRYVAFCVSQLNSVADDVSNAVPSSRFATLAQSIPPDRGRERRLRRVG